MLGLWPHDELFCGRDEQARIIVGVKGRHATGGFGCEHDRAS